MDTSHNALHSPLGARSSFVLGSLGKMGGFGLDVGNFVNHNILIGLERKKKSEFQVLPFYEESDSALEDKAQPAKAKKKKNTRRKPTLTPFRLEKIERNYELGSDTWRANDLEFTVYSPVQSAPDPLDSPIDEQKLAYCPAVVAELTIDNSNNKRERRAFFGYQGDDIRFYDKKGLTGIFRSQQAGIATDEPDAIGLRGSHIADILADKSTDNDHEASGSLGLIVLRVPSGKKKTFRFAICFHQASLSANGVPVSYWYARFYDDIYKVASFALKKFKTIKERALTSNRLIGGKLDTSGKFQMINAVRDYYSSTQLLNDNGRPFWLVNNGTDSRKVLNSGVTVNELFYEVRMNPWTVRNELDLFADSYSTDNKEKGNGAARCAKSRCLLSPVHDFSSELIGFGCFSNMSYEQLVKYVLCVTEYYKVVKNKKWMKRHIPVLKQCLERMVSYRSDHDEREADGEPDSQSKMLWRGGHDVHTAVKEWACFVAAERILTDFNDESDVMLATEYAKLAAKAITGHIGDVATETPEPISEKAVVNDVTEIKAKAGMKAAGGLGAIAVAVAEEEREEEETYTERPDTTIERDTEGVTSKTSEAETVSQEPEVAGQSPEPENIKAAEAEIAEPTEEVEAETKDDVAETESVPELGDVPPENTEAGYQEEPGDTEPKVGEESAVTPAETGIAEGDAEPKVGEIIDDGETVELRRRQPMEAASLAASEQAEENLMSANNELRGILYGEPEKLAKIIDKTIRELELLQKHGTHKFDYVSQTWGKFQIKVDCRRALAVAFHIADTDAAIELELCRDTLFSQLRLFGYGVRSVLINPDVVASPA